MYQPSIPHAPKEVCNLSCTITLVLVGVSGVLAKLKFPKVAVWADKLGLRQEYCRRFKVNTAWGSNMFQCVGGKFGLHGHKPEISFDRILCLMKTITEQN